MSGSGTKPEISIAVGVPLSGNGAALGREMANAIRLAVEESGDPINLLIGDDRGDEAAGSDLARRFIADETVVAVIGHYNSNVTLAAEPLYRAAALPLVAPIVSNPRLTRVGWTHVFRFTNSDDETGRAIAAHMRDALDKRRVALVASDTVYGRSMAEAFAAGFEAVGGTVGPKHVVAEGTRDFAALVAALPRDIDAVFYGGTFEGAPLLTASCATEHRGIAYPDPIRWDRRGENRAAVTALHVIRDGRFHQVALIKKAA